MSKTAKFTVSMSAEAFKQLESMRRKAGQTRSQFIRDAVRVWKIRSGQPSAVKEEPGGYGAPTATDLTDIKERRRRAIEAAGRFRSGVADLSSNHDKYLEDAYAEISMKKEKDRTRR